MRAAVALLSLTLLATPATADSVPQTVTVELSSFRFSPARLDLAVGRPYRLQFSNRSSGGHDFTAKRFFEASRVDAADGAKVSEGRVRLTGGELVSIVLVPQVTGDYTVTCSHFMHSTLGMRGTIRVR